MFFPVLFLLLSALASIDSAPAIMWQQPVNLSSLFDNYRYEVPVEIPYKLKMPSKDIIQLGFKNALETFEQQKAALKIAPSTKDIPAGGLKLDYAQDSTLWSKNEKNNNIVLAIHHEEPFELHFHLKSLSPGTAPAPEPEPVTVPPAVEPTEKPTQEDGEESAQSH